MIGVVVNDIRYWLIRRHIDSLLWLGQSINYFVHLVSIVASVYCSFCNIFYIYTYISTSLSQDHHRSYNHLQTPPITIHNNTKTIQHVSSHHYITYPSLIPGFLLCDWVYKVVQTRNIWNKNKFIKTYHSNILYH